MIFPSEKFYTLFADSYYDYSSNRKDYLLSVNKFINDESILVKSIIDVGSGDGKRGRYIADILELENITLVDNSEGMIALSKKIYGADIIQTDISNSNLEIKKSYDLVLLLWNVLGHVSVDRRKTALINLASLTNIDGSIFIDVNNRYNISHYGMWSVLKNIFKDIFLPNKLNGDFNLNIKTPKGEIETTVHIFSPFEIEKLIKLAGLKIEKKRVINYDNGKICRTIFEGQLLYKLSKL